MRGNPGGLGRHPNVPAQATGEDESGRPLPVPHGPHPRPDQRRHVLARLQRAEKGDVVQPVEAQCPPGCRDLFGRGRPEHRWVDAVRDDVHAIQVGMHHPGQFAPGRLTRDDAAGGAPRRQPGSGLEEPSLARCVQAARREESRVVQRDADGHPGPQGQGVMRTVQHRRPDVADKGGQARLLPDQARRTAGDSRRRLDHPGVRSQRREAGRVAALADHCEIDTGVVYPRDEPFDVTPDPASVSRDGGRVDQHAQRHATILPRLAPQPTAAQGTPQRTREAAADPVSDR